MFSTAAIGIKSPAFHGGAQFPIFQFSVFHILPKAHGGSGTLPLHRFSAIRSPTWEVE